MKTAIVTVAVNNAFKNILLYTKPFFDAYAKKTNSDFIYISESKINVKAEHLEKFQIYDLLQTYNRIIFFDCDIIVMDTAPNLFEIVSADKIGAVYDNPNNSKSYEYRKKEIDHIEDYFGKTEWNSQYINTGVLVLSSIHKKIFTNPEERLEFKSSYKDQTLINYNIFRNNFKIYNLHQKFNFIPIFWDKDRYEVGGFYNSKIQDMPYIIHFAGLKYKQRYIEKNIHWLIQNNHILDNEIIADIKKITPALFTIPLPKILDFSKGSKHLSRNKTQPKFPPKIINRITKSSIISKNEVNLPPQKYKLFYDISELGWSMYLSAHVKYLSNLGQMVAVSCSKAREVLYRNKCSKILPLPIDFILEYGHLPSDGNHLFDPITNKRLMAHSKFATYFKKEYPDYEIVTKYTKFENERTFEPYETEFETKNLCVHLFKDSPIILVFPRYRMSKFQARNIPKEYWVEIIEELLNVFPNTIVASIGAPNGAYDIEINNDKYFNGVKYDTNIMLELMIELCNTKQAVVAIGNQSGTLKITLLSGCPSFIFGNEKKRHLIDENWMKTPSQFYELPITDNGFIVSNLEDMKKEIIEFSKKQFKL